MSMDLIARLQTQDKEDLADELTRVVAALIGTAVRAMDPEDYNPSPQMVSDIREILELAGELTWIALEGCEGLQAEAKRSFWKRQPASAP